MSESTPLRITETKNKEVLTWVCMQHAYADRAQNRSLFDYNVEILQHPQFKVWCLYHDQERIGYIVTYLDKNQKIVDLVDLYFTDKTNETMKQMFVKTMEMEMAMLDYHVIRCMLPFPSNGSMEKELSIQRFSETLEPDDVTLSSKASIYKHMNQNVSQEIAIYVYTPYF
jgi:hypothetical protein